MKNLIKYTLGLPLIVGLSFGLCIFVPVFLPVEIITCGCIFLLSGKKVKPTNVLDYGTEFMLLLWEPIK